MNKKMKSERTAPPCSAFANSLSDTIVAGGAIRAKYDSGTGAGDRDELFDKSTEAALNDTEQFRGQQIIGAPRLVCRL